jgi:hypothetical protein
LQYCIVLMAEVRGSDHMFRKAIPTTQYGRRYEYVNTYSFQGNSTITSPDPGYAYLAVQINFCTASGNTTTTDTVSVDGGSINLGASNAPIIFAITFTDNAGDEGTGYSITAMTIPVGTTTFTVTGQSSEDFFQTKVILFKDRGANAASPAFLPRFGSYSGTATPSTAAVSNTTANSTFLYWQVHAANMNNLATTENTEDMKIFSGYGNILLVFYHGYGSVGSFAIAPIKLESDDVNTIAPAYSEVNLGTQTVGANALSVYHGEAIVRNINIDTRIVLTANSLISQGDNFVVVHF